MSTCRAMDGTVPAFIDSRVNRVYAFSTDANKTLSAQDSVAENLIIAAGTITAARTLTSYWAPTARRVQRVTNYTGFTVTFGWATGTGVALATKTWALVGNDGSGNAMIIAQGTVTGTGPVVSAGPFDPATLTLTSWVRGSYSGAPWAGVASAGTSGAKSMTAPGAAAATGTALNTYTPADFTPASLQYLRYVSNVLTDFFATGGYTYSVLVYGRNPAAPAGTYSDAQIVGNSDTVIGLGFSTSGVAPWHYNGTANVQTPWLAMSANAWHWVDVKYDGTNLMVRVDGSAWTTQASAAPAFSASYLQLARNYSPGYGDCKVMEFMTAASAISDANLASIRTSYIDTRYGLAL